METLNRCLKDWNATVEALGQGKQTILVRKNTTSYDKFFLYPTFSYATKDDYLDSFQKKYHNFVEDNAFPNTSEKDPEIKYYAKVEKIIEKNPNRISSLAKRFIWAKDHVKSYLGKEKAKIWLLRVYKLDNPFYTDFNRGIQYARLEKPRSISAQPVMTDKDFKEISSEILNK